MQVINISQQIDTAEKLISELKPVLNTFGSINYEIICKGKNEPVFILQLSFLKYNVWTSTIVNTIERLTNKVYYFTLETKENETKITLNIII